MLYRADYYESKQQQGWRLLVWILVSIPVLFCLLVEIHADESGLKDAISAAQARDRITTPDQIQRIRDAVRQGSVPPDMQTDALRGVIHDMLRYNDERSLEVLVQAARDRNLRQDVQKHLFLVLPLIEKNWGEDILDREVLHDLLADFAQARALVKRPKLEVEEVKKQFKDALDRYENLPFDPGERVDDIEEQSDRHIRMRENTMPNHIRMLIEYDISDTTEEIRQLTYESNHPFTVSACLEYLRTFDPEGSRKDFVHFFDDNKMSDSRVRYEAVHGLLSIGDGESVGVLGRFLVDKPDSRRVSNIIGAITRQPVEEAEDYLIQYIEKDGEYIMRAIRALGKTGGEQAVEFLADYGEAETRPHILAEIAKALVELESEQAMDILLEGLKSESWYFRQVSAELLADADSRDAIPQLRDALKSAKDAEERVIMLTSLARLDEKTAEQELLEKYEEAETYEFKIKVMQSFARLNGRPLSIALDSFDDTVLRIGRHKNQEILFERAKEIKPEIIEYLKDKTLSEHNFSTEMAFRCLLKTEPQDEESIELLKKAYEDYSEGSVRAVEQFAPLRAEIARYLEEVTGEEFRYTYFRQMPFR